MKSPLAQRTNGSWYHLLVRRRPAAGHPGPRSWRRPLGAL